MTVIPWMGIRRNRKGIRRNRKGSTIDAWSNKRTIMASEGVRVIPAKGFNRRQTRTPVEPLFIHPTQLLFSRRP